MHDVTMWHFLAMITMTTFISTLCLKKQPFLGVCSARAKTDRWDLGLWIAMPRTSSCRRRGFDFCNWGFLGSASMRGISNKHVWYLHITMNLSINWKTHWRLHPIISNYSMLVSSWRVGEYELVPMTWEPNFSVLSLRIVHEKTCSIFPSLTTGEFHVSWREGSFA